MFLPLPSYHKQHKRLLWPQKGYKFLHTSKQVSSSVVADTSWVSSNPVQFWHCLPGKRVSDPQVEGSVPTTAPAHFRHQLQAPGCLTCTSDPPVINQFPQTPFFGLINLLKQLTEPRETHLQVYYKRYYKGNRWGDA